MMRKGKRRRGAVYLAAAVIFTCYLGQTIDCYRLKETERREERNDPHAAKTAAVQEGRIIFGRGLEKGSGLESRVIDGTKNTFSNVSTEDKAAYQADSPVQSGWPKGRPHDSDGGESSWKRMTPSLQCGEDQMKFRAVGQDASQFAVDQGKAHPMPLSQIPPTCGYTMQRNPLALVMLVPYDGCNMVQEDGHYMLLMRWRGVPVALLCPFYPLPVTATPSPMFPCPFFPPCDPLVTTTKPTTTKTKPTKMTKTKLTDAEPTKTKLTNAEPAINNYGGAYYHTLCSGPPSSTDTALTTFSSTC
ncbi:uncharacterized protein LOC132978529 [Labrus mixtus]|uniref:uncharacterized protein LOC132978529 n=1 Tax=Labrus mixtus TaxID=508554 RepID=UPI0029C03B7D|nr:uncharacterized protein LOC132978529 [Labrus mixtus]